MTPIPKTNQKPDESIVNVYLEEYRVLTNEILKRIEFQERVLYYVIIIVTAFVTALSSTWSKGNFKFTTSNFNIILLFTPLIFYVSGLVYAFNDNSIVNIARYINKELRVNLSEILGNSSILGFEKFLHSQRKKFNNKIFGKVFSFFQRTFSIVVPVGILIYFLWKNPCLFSLPHFQTFLFFLDIIVGVISFILIINWNQKWESIAE